ncbi:MAG: hypothetical protein U0797_22870 [Gemmataceae bacterium]
MKKERDIAVAVNDFLHDLLGQADMGSQPFLGEKVVRNPKITVAELLDRAAKNIDGKFPGQEETEAAIRRTIGRYLPGGQVRAGSLPQLQRLSGAIPSRNWEPTTSTLTCRASLAVLYHFQGKGMAWRSHSCWKSSGRGRRS